MESQNFIAGQERWLKNTARFKVVSGNRAADRHRLLPQRQCEDVLDF